MQGHRQFSVLDDLQTGSLADYLGIPTTITGSYGQEEEFSPVFCTEDGFSGNICSTLLLQSSDKGQVSTFLESKKGDPITTVLSCSYSSNNLLNSLCFGFCVGNLPDSTSGKQGKVIVRGTIVTGKQIGRAHV